MLGYPISRASGPRPFRKSMFRRGPGLRRNIDLLLVLYENIYGKSNMIIYSPSHTHTPPPPPPPQPCWREKHFGERHIKKKHI